MKLVPQDNEGSVVELDEEEAAVLFSECQELPSAPLDRFAVVYWIFCILGMGILVPWVTILTAVDYFTLQYPQDNFEFNITVAYMYPLAFSMFFVVRFGRIMNASARIVLGYTIFLVTLLLIPFIRDMLSEAPAFGITLTLIAVLGLADAIAQGTLYGIAAMFPAVYIQAIASGNGMAGLLISATRIVTRLMFPETVEGLRGASILYFMISAGLIVLCIIGYIALLRMPIAKHYMQLGQPEDQQALTEEELTEPDKSIPVLSNTASFGGVMKKIWRYQLMICFNFTVTLFLFPGLFSVIPSMHGGDLDWFPVILISIFQVTDFIGKTIPVKWPNIFSERALYAIAASRIIFFPLFLLCVQPRVFTHDAIPIIIDLLFSISNGYVGAVTLMLAPSKVENHEKDLAGTIMAFSLVIGLTIGASLGWTLSFVV
eukprot:TRINITY_DN11275_c0_g1_i1.p1 TRINITY_DN11275_c0_g1~~TRINITY_DN11275_c0_g1_i1.p1  ORF type:complete len:462 (-),score=-40.46 TRINITY_DN11275_c0_g1_i1:62-1351(-)